MIERTRDLFEYIDGYTKAKPLTREVFDYNYELDKMFFLHKLIFKFYFNLSGFKAFNKELPKNFEHLARTIDLKGGALFSPVISFSASLLDDNKTVSPFERAALLVQSAFYLKDDIFYAKLSPDTNKGQVLEMGQYPNLFSTCQIIENKKARVFKAKLKNQITVICNGVFYLLDLEGFNFNEDINKLVVYLKYIAKDSNNKKSEKNYFSPGVITAANNPIQIRIFNKLVKKEVNRKNLELMRQSLFTLCLDLESNPASYEEIVMVTHSENYFNRWFHSSLQLVVFNNSKAGIIINFSANIGGNNMMRAASEIARRSELLHIDNAHISNNANFNCIKRLDWEVAKNHVKIAELSFIRIKDNLNTRASFTIEKIGKKDFGKYDKNAIPIFILALQLTAKKLTNRYPVITQFLTVSKYRCMDLLRAEVTTTQVIDFVDYINNDNFDIKIANKKLDLAIESQIKTTRQQRNHLPIHEQISLFMSTRKGILKFFNIILHLFHIALIWISGYVRLHRTEIIVSHPQIYSKVPIIGRPGIRIPYAKYFGLHYQIFDDKINITMMPSIKWKIPNEILVKELENQLLKIREIIIY